MASSSGGALLLLQRPFDCPEPHVKVGFSTFPDGEVMVRADGLCASGREVTVVWSTAAPRERPNDSLVALLQLLEVVRRSGAATVHCFLPYLPYQRQDRETYPGAPLSARLVLGLLHAAGASAVSTLDPHSPASVTGAPLQPVVLTADASLVRALGTEAPDVVVSPDAGGRARAERMATLLAVPCYTAGKVRVGGTTVVDDLPRALLGGRHVLVRDDLASTGSTLVPLVERLRAAGADRITVALTHLLCDPSTLAALLGAQIVHTNSCGQEQADVDVLDVLFEQGARGDVRPPRGGEQSSELLTTRTGAHR